VSNGERKDGLQEFAAVLQEFATTAPRLRLTQVIRRLRGPVRIAVHGRSGVGRSTVTGVLRRAGLAIAPDAARADVRVLVIAEGLKPEELVMPVTADARSDGATADARSDGGTADARSNGATDPPLLIVLNKADLTGSAGDGAMANAHRRAADVRALSGAPTVPLVGLLAETADGVLDHELVVALRTMVTEPADLTSVDAFIAADHTVSSDVRERLLAGLDRFGIAHAVVALARGAEPTDLPALFRNVSNVDALLAALRSVAAPVRYGRLRSALAELKALAVQFDDRRLSALLTSDAVVLAAMTAAVDVVEADGVTVDVRDDATAHLGRARHWRRYGSGPVNALHRNCSADIVRGSIRLLDGPP
jgi:hypothetical protein